MPTKTDWRAALAGEPGRITARHRNRSVIGGLTATTVALLSASLPAEFWLGSRGLVWACYAAAAITSAVLMAYLFDKRLWVEPPTR